MLEKGLENSPLTTIGIAPRIASGAVRRSVGRSQSISQLMASSAGAIRLVLHRESTVKAVSSIVV